MWLEWPSRVCMMERNKVSHWWVVIKTHRTTDLDGLEKLKFIFQMTLPMPGPWDEVTNYFTEHGSPRSQINIPTEARRLSKFVGAKYYKYIMGRRFFWCDYRSTIPGERNPMVRSSRGLARFGLSLSYGVGSWITVKLAIDGHIWYLFIVSLVCAVNAVTVKMKPAIWSRGLNVSELWEIC
jgi:hypothetical protein